MVQLGVPFERDPELDLIKIDNVPHRLQNYDEISRLEERLLEFPGINLLVITRGFDPEGKQYFYGIYCPGSRY